MLSLRRRHKVIIILIGCYHTEVALQQFLDICFGVPHMAGSLYFFYILTTGFANNIPSTQVVVH